MSNKQEEQLSILREMMSEMDEIADQIPEGSYLVMCDCAKRMHTSLSQKPQSSYMSRRRCGVCRELGHDRRSCPNRGRLVSQPVSAPRPVVVRRQVSRCLPPWLWPF